MGQALFIAEKPAMGRALAAALGGRGGGDGYIDTPKGKVTWAFGHLLREASPDEIDPKFEKWSLKDLPILLDRIPVRPDESSVKQLRLIGALMKGADSVVIATDADRAGERIAREILEYHGWRGRTARLLLRSPERSDIEDALDAMHRDPQSAERTHPWAFEERARAHEDWHIGMNGTRAGSIQLRPSALARSGKPWSVGGVQTPVLALIVTRDKEIENFVPRDYFTIDAEVKTDKGTLTLAHAPKDQGRIFDRAVADKVREAAAAWKGPLDVVDEPEQISPFKFFGQTSLQRTAGKMFGWSPAKTLEVAQSLYEQGYITYPRGDCEYLGKSSLPKVKAALEKIRHLPGFEALDAYLAKHPPVIRDGGRYNDAKAKASAHEAIVPTAKVPDLRELSGDQRALYLALARNLAMNHMPNGVDDTKTVSFSVAVDGKERRFTLSGRQVREAGWRALSDIDDGDEKKPMPKVANGDRGEVTDASVEKRQTEPPKRWAPWDLPSVMGRLEEYIEDAPLSDAEKEKLLKALESDTSEEMRGLGTPATRASIIATLVDREYIEVVGAGGKALSAAEVKSALEGGTGKGGKGAKAGDKPDAKGKAKKTLLVRATANGRILVETWQKVFPRLTDPIQRARLEHALRGIGRSKDATAASGEFAKFVARVREDTVQMVEAARGAERATATDIEAGSMRSVSKKQLDYAKTIAKFRKLDIPDEVKANAKLLSDWIDKNKARDGEAMASAKQIDLAKKAVEVLGLEDNIKTLGRDHARVLQILEEHPVSSWPASEKMKGAVASIAKAKNVELPENWRDDSAFIRKFLDENAGEKGADGPASDKSVAFARQIAQQKGLKVDIDAMAGSQSQISAFIDKNKDEDRRGGSRAGGARGR